MIRKAVPLIAIFLVAGHLSAETYVPRASTWFRFNELEQKHPKSTVVALPITGPVVGIDGGPLSFTALYMTHINQPEDPRNSTGKVTLTIEVIRDNQVLWETTKKSKVKNDRHTTNQCGNCTHNLEFCNTFIDSLQKGDLVLFHFQFKGMPKFNLGEFTTAGGEVYVFDNCK